VRIRALPQPAHFAGATPFVILAAMGTSLAVLPLVSDRSVTVFNVYNVLQSFAAMGLIALGLGLAMIAGEFDLSLPATFAVGAMIAVLTGVDAPVLGVAAALGAALAIGFTQGFVVARIGVSSMPVTLGGYLFVLGLANVLGESRSVPYPNYSVGDALDRPIAQVLSGRSVVALGVFLFAALVMRYTRWGRDIRAVGGDRRAARTAGVRVERVLVAVFASAAVAAGLSGALLGYSLATATPDLGAIDRLIFAATAVLLGGVAVTGGQGSPVGIAAGVLSLSILSEEFAILAVPTYVSSLVTGALLAVVTIFAAPDLMRWWRSTSQPRAASRLG
jgi:ribose transport system permease protein